MVKTGFTKGSYYSVKQCFRIEIRTNKEFNDKFKRMRAIAEEKEMGLVG